MTIDELLNVKVVFGLENQGKIPIIEQMLSEGKDWYEIAETIGWEHSTAREHYERCVNENKACSVLAKTVELLKDLIEEQPFWKRSEIHTAIFAAEKHLLSTPKKKIK